MCNEFSLRRRQIFINDILKVNPNFNILDKKRLFNYILYLNDCSIFDLTVLFIKNTDYELLWRAMYLQHQNYKVSTYYNKDLELYSLKLHFFFLIILDLH